MRACCGCARRRDWCASGSSSTIAGTRADANKDRLEPDTAEQIVSGILADAERVDAGEDRLAEDAQRAIRGLAPEPLGGDEGCAARLDAAVEVLSAQATPRPTSGLMGAERPAGGARGHGREIAARRRGRRNKTDPDSRLMRAPSGWVQGYNAQVAVDESHLIVACDVSQDGFDNHQLAPMVARTEEALRDAGVRQAVGCFLADGGYWKGEMIDELAAIGTRLLVPPNGRPRTKNIRPSESVQRMERRLRHTANRRRYRRRQALVEPVIAHAKVGRGFARFQLRGLAGAQLEWSLACTAHNLARLAVHHRTR